MLRPSMNDILKPGQSYYSFVMAVAKRAREIASESEERGIVLDRKSVDMAVDDFESGKCFLNETEESKG